MDTTNIDVEELVKYHMAEIAKLNYYDGFFVEYIECIYRDSNNIYNKIYAHCKNI